MASGGIRNGINSQCKCPQSLPKVDTPGYFRHLKGNTQRLFSYHLLGLIWISPSHFKQSKNSTLISQIYVMQCLIVNFWVI